MSLIDTDDFAISNWSIQLRKGLLELCIVNLLYNNELYAYDLVKRLAGIRGVVVSEGTAYPLLSRLRTAGLITSRLEESSSGPARKYYRLTPEGERAMDVMNLYWKDVVDGVSSLMAAGIERGGESKHHG